MFDNSGTPNGKCLSKADCKTEIGNDGEWLCTSSLQATSDTTKFVKLCAPVNLNIIDARLICTNGEEAAAERLL